MPPPKKSAAGVKRKSPSPSSPPSTKKVKTLPDEDAGETPPLVDRRFYPPEMTNERCAEYIQNKHPRPIEVLDKSLSSTKAQRDKITAGQTVVHWFKMDLRLQDNHSLHAASVKARESGASLVCLYVLCPEELEAHLTSPIKVDFMLRALQIMQKDLAALDIPLHVETVEKRKDVTSRIIHLCKEWKANHLFANVEYEVNELRREAKLVKMGAETGVAVDVLRDTCIVAPGEVQTGQGKQFAVFTPFYRAWMAFLHNHPDRLELFEGPQRNPDTTRKTFESLFDQKIPSAPSNKLLSKEEKERFESMWPAGEHEAQRRLDKFLNEIVGRYDAMRNFPASNGVSKLSPHFAAGTLSARTAVAAAQKANSTRKLDGGNQGIKTWISEVAWRDFYKHVMAHWPFICMNKCFKPEYTSIDWSYNNAYFEAWKEGRTGYPIVDAAMRQLNHTGWMHNRPRMVVSSFLSKDLLVDWRLGEQYFMTKLVDADFASNHGGWGFGSSTGVDPQPYFRIFNPKLQSEKFDAEGKYIRKWVPELKALNNKEIHAPWDSQNGQAVAKKNGYPRPIVDHAKARIKCLEVYKRGLGRDTT